MECKKCGNPINPDAKQCENCGEPVVPEEPAKKKGKAKYWLIGAASFLFAIVVLVGVFFPDIVAWTERLVLSPEMLMKKAVASAAQDIGNDVFSGADSSKMAKEYKIGLLLDEAVREFLSGEDGEEDTWLSELNLKLTSGKSGDLQRTQLSLLVKEQSVFSLDLIQNENTTWLGVPELQKTYLEYGKEDLNWGQMGDLSEKLPSRKDLLQMIRTYGTILFDSTHRVTKENVTLRIEGVSQAVLQLTATIHQADASSTLSKMAMQLKEDETIRELLTGWLGQGTDLHANAVNYLEALSANVKGDLELIAYLDRYNTLTGLQLADTNGNIVFYCAKAVSEGKFADLLTFGDLLLSGKGSCSKGKETGEYTLAIGEKAVLTCQVKDFSVTDKGFTGSVVVPVFGDYGVPGIGSSDAELCLELSQKTVSGEEVLSVNLVVDKEPMVGLFVTAGKAKSFSVEVPASVISAKKQENIEHWLQGLDWNILANKLQDADVPLDLIGSLLP